MRTRPSVCTVHPFFFFCSKKRVDNKFRADRQAGEQANMMTTLKVVEVKKKMNEI